MVWNRFRQWLKERRLRKLRDSAMKYMYLLDVQMKYDGESRAKRRQFKRDLLNSFWPIEQAKQIEKARKNAGKH